ncbi:MAG: Uma2 family endonuclease [Candidatus Tectomicrobia bacterium]|uniref:Uma2 family endonuclease n=1 Tax=Tectimicrobiota bacterium TaxID=2528274 RepID=A0A932CPJ0_UNCTE|nr:Uma2 family endonuclease [Candidatus Tectomicrobia bacterium]
MVNTPRTLSQPRLALAEFYRLPEGPPYYEYEDGILIEMNRPTPRHQQVLGEIYGELRSYLREHPMGLLLLEVNVELLGRKVYTPDLILTPQEQAGQPNPQEALSVVPALIVEVLSPSTVGHDQVTKLNTYCQAGVPWHWIIDPEALTILEYRLAKDGHYMVHTAVERGQVFRPGLFPGLEIDLCALLGEEPAPAGS